MSLRRHYKLLINATIAWLIFVIIGLPNYYGDWPFNNLLYLSIATYFLIGLIFYSIIRKRTGNIKLVLWAAFYFTVPFIAYDLIYIHFILREPADFLNRFWFLSVFYIIPWIQAPIIYLYLNKKYREKTWALIGIACLIAAGVLWRLWGAFEGGFFEVMVDSPERNSTMLGSALKYSIYGTFLSMGFLLLFRYSYKITKVFSGSKN